MSDGCVLSIIDKGLFQAQALKCSTRIADQVGWRRDALTEARRESVRAKRTRLLRRMATLGCGAVENDRTVENEAHSGRTYEDRIMNNETRAQALLNSPVGCALVLDVSENRHLPLEHFAEPKVSFWLVASAMDLMDPYTDGDGDMNQRMAFNDARAQEDLALRIVSHPAFA